MQSNTPRNMQDNCVQISDEGNIYLLKEIEIYDRNNHSRHRGLIYVYIFCQQNQHTQKCW
jgi:hypothetical protein